MKLYNYIIENAATKKDAALGYNCLFQIQTVKKCNI